MDFRINISYQDLSPAWRDAADVLSLEAVIALVRNYGGELLYIPRIERFEREARNRTIRTQRSAGAGTRELAIRWNISERQILRICGGD